MHAHAQLYRWAREHCVRGLARVDELVHSANTKTEHARAEAVVPAKVLIVDDDEILCEAMELTLGREGLEIAWVGAAQDALDRLRAADFDFDVIITDMTMPVMGGLELCEHVQALRADVPVIMLSGHATVEAAASARRAGVFDYLVKPVNAKVLSVAVEAAIRHRHGI